MATQTLSGMDTPGPIHIAKPSHALKVKSSMLEKGTLIILFQDIQDAVIDKFTDFRYLKTNLKYNLSLFKQPWS